MEVQGILLKGEAGEEFLLSVSDPRGRGPLGLFIQIRQDSGWVPAKLPARQKLAMISLGYMSLCNAARWLSESRALPIEEPAEVSAWH